jgi:hypothetical protein
MSEGKVPVQSVAQAGSSGQAASVGPAVGGVRRSEDISWLDLWALNPETRAYLRSARRDAACWHALSRREGAGDGPDPSGITTPEKLRHLQDTLYRKAKAEPGYRFWSLYGELTRRDLLEHALRLAVRNGGAPGVDGQTLGHITATPETRSHWLTGLEEELKTKTYRPAPVRRVFIPKSLWHLVRQWLDAPVVEEKDGQRHVLPNRQGVPQGGVISPLLANLYLNALDWEVNAPQVRGRPVMVRSADDFVILCAPGQGRSLRERLARWLAPRGLKLNEDKTRVADSRDGFNFLGFTVRWQRSRRSGNGYAHVEASARSAQHLREVVRSKLNHWTLGQRIPEVRAGLNRLLRGWSGYFHYRQSSRVMDKLNWQVRDRLRRWLWRKHGRKRAWWSDYPDQRLQDQYGLWPLPKRVAWQRTIDSNPHALR